MALCFQIKVIKYIKIYTLMPPKKVRQANPQEKAQESTAKPAEKTNSVPQEIPKQQPKVETKISTQNNVSTTNTPSIKLQQKPTPLNPSPEHQLSQPKSSKIATDDVEKLTQQQRVKLRMLRFGIIGTATLGAQTEKIKEERLKKFGNASSAEDPATLEQRKKKFSNEPEMLEDNETVQQRLKKFGQVSSIMVAEDPSVVQERKKKFGNVQMDVDLNALIEKSKKIKKEHKGPHNKGNGHQNRGHNKSFGNRFRN